MEKTFISLQQAMDLLPDGVLIVNTEGIIENANKQAAIMFGYEQGELGQQPLQKLIPERFHSRHSEHLKAYYNNPSVRKMGAERTALFGLKKDMTEFDVDIALSPVTIHDTRYALAIVRDITDKKDLERMLTWKNEQLQVINKELDKFGYTVSHDLKSPLANIKAIVYLLMRKLPKEKSEELNEMVTYLNMSLDSMADLISGIAAYSKTTISNDFEEVDLNEVIEEIRRLVMLPAHFTLRFSGRLPVVLGIKTKLLQVFLNLITNTIKYNDKKEGVIQISCSDNGHHWVICFEDNGPGIPVELREKVFDLFEKGLSQRSDSQGLGLAIVKKNIQDNGGKIKLKESELGGVRFQIVLPKKPLLLHSHQ